MQQFDTLAIQKNIEEKRLILGKKFADFLSKKISCFGDFFQKILAAKSCGLFGCIVIIAISILARSSRDIGHDSAACLEIAKKFLAGGKYYQDFFENNLPLFFYFASIPHLLAKFFAISPIIALEIFSNLVGILTIYFSARILSRSELAKDRIIFNLVILSLAGGFFLRVFTLQFNEFGTKSTYFLAFAFPYISYQFLKNSALKNSDQIVIGILAALLFCLKPHYVILVIIFEAAKLLEKKSLKSVFNLKNFTTFLLLICYLIFLLIHFPDYIAALPSFSSTYFDWRQISHIFSIIKEDLFPIFLLIFLCRFLFKKNNFLYPLFLAAISAALISAAELIGGYDQKFAFYSLSLPLLVLTTFLIVKNDHINWRRDGFFLLLILILPQFDQKNIFTTAINICAFWWLFVLFLAPKFKKFHLEKNFQSQIFVPQDLSSWLSFLSLTALTFILSIRLQDEIAWIFSALIFAAMINFYQKLQDSKKFSRLSASTIFMVLSYVLGLHLSAIFNFHFYDVYRYKSPNYVNEEMAKMINNYGGEGEVTVIASMIPGSYPVISYMKKDNPLPSLSFLSHYIKMDDDKEISPTQKYLLSRLKQQLQNEKNKLVFVERKKDALDNECRVGFLEYYFRADPELHKIFSKNYIFLNRIIEQKPAEKKVEFFAEGKDFKWSGSPEFIEHDVEVYIRKNAK